MLWAAAATDSPLALQASGPWAPPPGWARALDSDSDVHLALKVLTTCVHVVVSRRVSRVLLPIIFLTGALAHFEKGNLSYAALQ